VVSNLLKGLQAQPHVSIPFRLAPLQELNAKSLTNRIEKWFL